MITCKFKRCISEFSHQTVGLIVLSYIELLLMVNFQQTNALEIILFGHFCRRLLTLCPGKPKNVYCIPYLSYPNLPKIVTVPLSSGGQNQNWSVLPQFCRGGGCWGSSYSQEHSRMAFFKFLQGC